MTITEKIYNLYKDDNSIDRLTSQEAINQTYRILTHGGINSAWIYTGTGRTPRNINGILITRPNINAQMEKQADYAFNLHKEIYLFIYINHMIKNY